MPAPLAPPPPVMSTLRNAPHQPKTRRTDPEVPGQNDEQMSSQSNLRPRNDEDPGNLQVSRGPSVRL